MDNSTLKKNSCFILYGCNGQDGRILQTILESIYTDCTYLLVSRDSLRIKFRGKSSTAINSEAHNDILCYLLHNIKHYSPERIYYFAAQHQSSGELIDGNKENKADLIYTNKEIPLKLLHACISNNIRTKFIYASSALIFSGSKEYPQNENTQPKPTCLYGESKVNTSHELNKLISSNDNNCQLYNLILYGHESLFRSERFFTKKLINHLLVNSTKNKYEKKIFYNPDALLDIGYAPEYMIFSEKIICDSKPGDYIISSGCQIKLETFVQSCCDFFNLEINNVVDFQITKPRAKTILFGDASKARINVGFEPKITGTKLAFVMCEDAQLGSMKHRIEKIISSVL